MRLEPFSAIPLNPVWATPCEYNDNQKRVFHQRARQRLATLAGILGWQKGSYDLRSNKGGIAVSGEITLHHDEVYIQVSQSCGSPGMGVLYRTCKGRKDYRGGQNHFASLAMLDDLQLLAADIKRTLDLN